MSRIRKKRHKDPSCVRAPSVGGNRRSLVLDPGKSKPGCLNTRMIHVHKKSYEKDTVKVERHRLLASGNCKKKCPEKRNKAEHRYTVLGHDITMRRD